MTHDYDAQTAVELPRIDSASGVTIGTSLIAAHAAETGLPAHVNAAMKFFASANETLQSAVFSAADAGGDPTFLSESRREAAAWSTAWTWARSAAKLSHPKKAEAAKKILATLFSEGIAFVRLATAPRWTETERRLLAVKEEKLEALFALLGGGDFLSDIIDAHKALGHAAGITAAPGVTMKSGVQAAFDHWKAAARCYVTQVIASHALAKMFAPNDAEADALSKRLLHALSSIETTSAKPEKKTEKETDPADPKEPPAETDAPVAPPTAPASS